MKRLLFLCFLSTAARAQTDSAQWLQATEVKAFAQQRKLTDIPAAVSVIGKAQLNRFGNMSLVPVLNTQPGIRMEERSPGSYRMNIRGSSLRAPFGVRNVKVYYNDIPYTTPGGDSYFNQLGFTTISSLEIIKGPGSSMYGAGTGGVILLQSEPAKFNEGISMMASGGNWGTQNYSLALRGGNEKFQNHFNYQDQRSEGYRIQSAMKRKVLNWDLKAKTGEKGELSGHFLYSDLFYETPGALNRREFDSFPQAARPRVGATPGAVEARASIKQQTFFAGIQYRYQFNENWSEVTSLYGAFTRLRNPGIFNYSWTQEAHTGGRTHYEYRNKRLTAQLGAEFQQGFTSARTFRNLNGNPDTLRTDDDVNNRSFIVLAQGTLEIGKGWLITAGVSLNQLRTQVSRLNRFPVTVNEKKYSNEWAPRLALLKKLNPSVSVYASIAKGFSPPTTSEILPSSGILSTDLEAEQGWNYEAGSRGQFLNGRFSYDVNLFYFSLRNAIVIRRDALGRDFFVNAGSTKQQGIETALSYWFVSGKGATGKASRLWLSHTFYDFSYKNYQKGTSDFSGKDLPSVPRHAFVGGLDLNHKKGLYCNITYTYTDPIPLNDANTDFSSAVHLLSTRLGWNKKWSTGLRTDFFISGENLTNADYSAGFDLNAAGGRYYNAAPLRSWMAGVIVEWGKESSK